MKPMGSASALKRILNCPASNILGPTEEQKTSDAADRGNKIHAYLEFAPDDMDKAIKEAANRIQTCKKINVKETAGFYTKIDYREIRMAYDIETDKSRMIPKTENARDYGEIGEFEIPGTADVFIRGWYTYEVVDYKTGQIDVLAKNNPQLIHLAMMGRELLSPEAHIGYVSIQQLKGHGKWSNRTASVDRFDIEEHKEKLLKTKERVEEFIEIKKDGGTPPVNPGDWCFFCPSKAKCPAQN